MIIFVETNKNFIMKTNKSALVYFSEYKIRKYFKHNSSCMSFEMLDNFNENRLFEPVKQLVLLLIHCKVSNRYMRSVTIKLVSYNNKIDFSACRCLKNDMNFYISNSLDLNGKIRFNTDNLYSIVSIIDNIVISQKR